MSNRDLIYKDIILSAVPPHGTLITAQLYEDLLEIRDCLLISPQSRFPTFPCKVISHLRIENSAHEAGCSRGTR